MNKSQVKRIFTNEESGLVNPEDYRNGYGKLEMNPFVSKKDGVFEVRDSFFYRHGKTAQDWQAKVEKFAADNGMQISVIESGEKWQVYPKVSYWWVRFTVEAI